MISHPKSLGLGVFISQECSDFGKGIYIYCILYDIPTASIWGITHEHFWILTLGWHGSYKKSQVHSGPGLPPIVLYKTFTFQVLFFFFFKDFRIADKELWTYLYIRFAVEIFSLWLSPTHLKKNKQTEYSIMHSNRLL